MGYTPWCDGSGKVLDDGTIARLAENDFRMTAAEPNLRWLQDNAMELEVEIEDVSESLAAAFAPGPGVARDPRRHRAQVFPPRPQAPSGIPVAISRTGYTGISATRSGCRPGMLSSCGIT